jgi:hypothetical protein
MSEPTRRRAKRGFTWVALLSFALSMTAQQTAPQQTTPTEQATGSTPQSAAPAAAPSTSAPVQVRLPEGTEVTLEFDQDVSSATATDDDKINFRVADDVMVGKVIAAKAGAIAVGTVTHARKRGHMGKAGELNIRLDYMKVGDTRVKLRAAKGKEGDSKIGATVALTVLFGPLGLLKRGHDIDIKKGAKITAWVEQDTTVSPGI